MPWILIALLWAGGSWVRVEALKAQTGLHYDGILYCALGSQLRQAPLNYDPRWIRPHLKQVFPDNPVPAYLNEPIFKHPPVFPWIISSIEPSFRSSMLVACGAGLITLAAVPAAAAAVSTGAAWTAAAALTMIAADPAHWVLSSQGLMSTTLTLFIFLGVVFFVIGMRRRSFFAVSGVFCGLAVMTHYSGMLALAGIFLYVMIYDRRWTASAPFWSIPGLTAAALFPWLVMNYAAYGPGFLPKMITAHGSDLNRTLIGWTIVMMVLLVFTLTLTALYQYRKGRSQRHSAILLTAGRILAWLPAASIAMILGALLLKGDLFRSMMLGFAWNELPGHYASSQNIRTAPWGFYFLRLLELSPFHTAAFAGMLVCFFKKDLESRLLPFAVTALLILIWFTLYSEFETRYILPAVPFLAVIAGWLLTQWRDRIRFAVPVFLIYGLLKALQAGSRLAFDRTVFF